MAAWCGSGRWWCDPASRKIESVRLPRIGEVVYQGLPLAAVTVAGQPQHTIPAPVSGVVVAVNEALEADPAVAAYRSLRRRLDCLHQSDAAGRGDGELHAASRHSLEPGLGVGPGAGGEAAPARLRRLHDRRSEGRGSTARKDAGSPVLLFDGTAFGTEGPGIVGAINAQNPSMKGRRVRSRLTGFWSRPIASAAFSTMRSSRSPTTRSPRSWRPRFQPPPSRAVLCAPRVRPSAGQHQHHQPEPHARALDGGSGVAATRRRLGPTAAAQADAAAIPAGKLAQLIRHHADEYFERGRATAIV